MSKKELVVAALAVKEKLETILKEGPLKESHDPDLGILEKFLASAAKEEEPRPARMTLSIVDVESFKLAERAYKDADSSGSQAPIEGILQLKDLLGHLNRQGRPIMAEVPKVRRLQDFCTALARHASAA